MKKKDETKELLLARIEELEKSEALLKKITDTAEDFLFVIGPTGRLEFINELAVKMMKQPLKDLLGKKVSELFPPEFSKGYENNIKKAQKTGESVYSEAKAVFPGKVVWLETRLTPLKNKKGKIAGIVGISRDITTQKMAEEYAKKTRKEWKDIFQAIGHPTIIMDKKHTIITANEATAEAVGIPEHKMIGKKCYEFFHGTKKPPRSCPMDKMLRTGKLETEVMEMEALGGYFLVSCTPVLDDEGKLEKIIHIATDITDRKQAEEALLENEEKYRTLIENMNEVVYSVDAEGTITYMSPRIELLIGIKSEDIAGETFTEFIHEDDLARAFEEFLKVISGEVTSNEYRVYTKSGELRWIGSSNHPVYAGKEVVGTTGVIFDITERKLAEEEIKKYQEKLEDLVSERTEELETFAYSISHDLRAPLRAMEGFTTALVEDYGDRLDEKGQEYAQRIIGASRRMDDLINDILAYSRISRTELDIRPMDLNRAVNDAKGQLEQEIEDKKAQIKIKGKLPHVNGHYIMVVQIITNLISNAIKYVGPRTKPRVTIWAESKKGEVRLYVQDNGIGIEPKHQERIFKIFERLHGMEHYSGTGIGLGLVKKGVLRMGGGVGVESKPKKGSKFWIELPWVK